MQNRLLHKMMHNFYSFQQNAVPICGETEYNAELDVEKLINPLAYPEAYSTSYRYCWYSIVSPESTVIRFWVEDFGTENFSNYLLRVCNHKR